jgi:hypothetical protein
MAGIALGVTIGRIGDAHGRAIYRFGGAFIALAGVAGTPRQAHAGAG